MNLLTQIKLENNEQLSSDELKEVQSEINNFEIMKIELELLAEEDLIPEPISKILKEILEGKFEINEIKEYF